MHVVLPCCQLTPKICPNKTGTSMTLLMMAAWLVAVVATQSTTRALYNQQMSSKPCWVNGLEGKCMFVWECINSSGRHVGVCVDAFMFGTCCAHNLTSDSSESSSEEPAVLFSPPKRPTTHPQTSLLTQATTTRPPWQTGSSWQTSSKPSWQSSSSQTTSRPTWQSSSSQTTSRPSWQSSSSPSHTTSKPSWHGSTPSQTSGPPQTSPKPTWQTPSSWHSTLQVTHKPTELVVYTNRPSFVTKPVKPSSQHTQTWSNKPWENEVDGPGENQVEGVWSTTASWHSSSFVTKVKPRPTKRPTTQVKPISTTKRPLPPPITTTPRPATSRRTTTTTPRPATSRRTTTTTATTTTTTRPPTTTPATLAAHTAKNQCGMSQLLMRPEVRIVGGRNAQFGDWPWQVSVRRTSFFGFSSTHRCGGALINDKWIATAGHCVDDLLLSQIRLRVGEYDFSSLDEPLPFAERGAVRKVVHPNYNFFTYEFDLALVRMDSGVEFAPHIAPICLPGSDDLLIGENATVTGWGRLSDGGTLPSVLQEVTVPILSNERCKYLFLRAGRHEFFPDIFMCAGFADGGRDACQGDSGGPLQVRGKDGRYFLAGIISWGIGCAEANLPGVCTRISKFVPWILETVA